MDSVARLLSGVGASKSTALDRTLTALLDDYDLNGWPTVEEVVGSGSSGGSGGGRDYITSSSGGGSDRSRMSATITINLSGEIADVTEVLSNLQDALEGPGGEVEDCREHYPNVAIGLTVQYQK